MDVILVMIAIILAWFLLKSLLAACIVLLIGVLVVWVVRNTRI